MQIPAPQATRRDRSQRKSSLSFSRSSNSSSSSRRRRRNSSSNRSSRISNSSSVVVVVVAVVVVVVTRRWFEAINFINTLFINQIHPPQGGTPFRD